MTDGNQKPDDVVDGFDLPGGEATPAPEEETPREDAGEFEMPEGEDVEAPDAAPSTEMVDGFDLAGGEVVPPPDLGSAPFATTAPHVKAAGKRPSVLGKFIAIIIVPAIAIPVIFFMMREKKKVAESYKEEFVAAAERFMTLMSEGVEDDKDASFIEACSILDDKVEQQKSREKVEEEYTLASEGLGRFGSLEDVDWEDPGRQAYSAFRATAVFEEGRTRVWFKMMLRDGKPRIQKFNLDLAVEAEDTESVESANVKLIKSEHLKTSRAFLTHLSSGDTDKAHGLLWDTLQKTTAPDALGQKFEAAAGSLGAFRELTDVRWDPGISMHRGAFSAVAKFSGGGVNVRLQLRGWNYVRITAFHFGK